MDRLEAMSIALTVAETGSLSAAARRLNTPLATVSRKVTDLESHLRVKLFNRSSRKLLPTEAGRSYIAAARRILADLTEAERAASGEYTAPTGHLIVTATLGLGRVHLVPILAEFLGTYPDIDVHLVLSDSVMSLIEEAIDVALRIGELPDSSLVARRVGTARRILCASPTYLAARGTPLNPEDLGRHDCISLPACVAPDIWSFVRGNTEVAVPVRSRLVVGSADAALEAACAGLGITAAFSYHARAAVEAGALQIVLDDFQPAPRPINLVYTASNLLPIKLHAFLDFAAPRLKARLTS